MWFRLQMTPVMQGMMAFRDWHSGGCEQAMMLTTSARRGAQAENLC